MMIASVNGTAGQFGQTQLKQTLDKGVDFRCSSTICYGVGAQNDQLLHDVQKAINSYASRVGFTPITVDGKIGAQTVYAAGLAARAADTLPPGNTIEAVATNAPWLRDELMRAQSETAAAASAPTTSTATAAPGKPRPTTMVPYTPGTTVTTATATAPKQKTPVWVWMLGGAAAAGAIGAVGYALRSKTATATPPRSLGKRRRRKAR